MLLRTILPLLWSFLCSILLIFTALISISHKIPMALLYSVFLITCFTPIFFIERNISKNINIKIRLLILSILSTISVIFISFICFFEIIFYFHKHYNWYDEAMNYLYVFLIISGSLVAFVIWFWVSSIFNKIFAFTKIAKFELIVLLMATYAACLTMDYVTFVLGHPPGMSS